MWLLEVKLSNNYSKIADSISNFTWSPHKEFTGRKKQACQVKKDTGGKFDDKVIAFIDLKENSLKRWRTKLYEQRYELLKKDVTNEAIAIDKLQADIAKKMAV